MKRAMLVGLLVAVSISGCHRRLDSAEEYASVGSGGEDEDTDGDTDEGAPISDQDRADASGVAVLSDGDGQATEVLELVDVHEPPGSESRGLADLRVRAQRVGAQALTDVETHPPAPGENVTHFSGVAVRFNDLLHGRAYDVIADVDVDASMLHEHDALEELDRRAFQELHADLLIDIRFEHGDGTGPLHLRGRAIRIRELH